LSETKGLIVYIYRESVRASVVCHSPAESNVPYVSASEMASLGAPPQMLTSSFVCGRGAESVDVVRRCPDSPPLCLRRRRRLRCCCCCCCGDGNEMRPRRRRWRGPNYLSVNETRM